jgi:hypothetical protein
MSVASWRGQSGIVHSGLQVKTGHRMHKATKSFFMKPERPGLNDVRVRQMTDEEKERFGVDDTFMATPRVSDVREAVKPIMESLGVAFSIVPSNVSASMMNDKRLGVGIWPMRNGKGICVKLSPSCNEDLTKKISDELKAGGFRIAFEYPDFFCVTGRPSHDG